MQIAHQVYLADCAQAGKLPARRGSTCRQFFENPNYIPEGHLHEVRERIESALGVRASYRVTCVCAARWSPSAAAHSGYSTVDARRSGRDCSTKGKRRFKSHCFCGDVRAVGRGLQRAGEYGRVAARVAHYRGPDVFANGSRYEALRKYYSLHEHTGLIRHVEPIYFICAGHRRRAGFQVSLPSRRAASRRFANRRFQHSNGQFLPGSATRPNLAANPAGVYHADGDAAAADGKNRAANYGLSFAKCCSSDSPRRFTVYIEPLVGVSTNFRNYGDRYFFIVNGDAEPPLNEMRHAFLHYLFDQLPVKFGSAIESTRPLYKIALSAPMLPAEYRDDYAAYFAECVIRAVELRLDKLSNQQRAQAIDQDDADGFVLVRPLMTSLDQFQAAEPAMKYYFPALALKINVKTETARVQTLRFAPRQRRSHY